MASGASSSSSLSTSVFTYDVFLSFRGEDTRYGFTGNLYSALSQRGIFTFIDDHQLPIGNQITPSLLKAIQDSRIAIVVLSKNYATSTFCLDELANIIHCFKGLVIPVFYDVEPTHVRKQTDTFGEALAKHEANFRAKSNSHNFNDNMVRLTKWRLALKQIADLSGYHFKQGYGYEHKLIAKIVHQVSRAIRRVALPSIDHPVGLHSQVKNVISLLDVGSSDGVSILGIHGIGGIGKTTLAVAVYNWIDDHFEEFSFEGLCFLENIRENSNKYGLQHLQKIVLFEIVGEKKIEFASVKQGVSLLKQRLRRKKILLILDDVDQHEQLEALAGKLDWFGPGSKVVITTRDISLLSRYEDKITYELETLKEKDALELLSWKALKTDQFDSSYMEILNEVSTYASGLPLALEVIGSNLVGKSIGQWKSALHQYKSIPNKKIQAILKVSFDALEEFEKEVFLDLACCLKGYKLRDAEKILCAHHSIVSVEYCLRVLVEKSLIKIHGYINQVTLHDLIQDMGREIVRQESPKRPGERSRVWFLEDIVQVFENNMGTDKIEMIHMDFPKFEKVIKWDGEAFNNMRNLRTLIVIQARFSQGPKQLPTSLRVLKWRQYPSHSLPLGFHPKQLVIFQLSGPRLMSIEFLHKQQFGSLTVLKFNYSNIEKIPDVSGIPNLKELSFSSCGNLTEVHESVGLLDKLQVLNAFNCRKLKSFPPIKLTNLESLDLKNCSRLENFPEILGKMDSLLDLSLWGTSIKELPSSITNLTKLRSLEIFMGYEMVHLPSSIAMLPCLEELELHKSKGFQFSKPEEGEEQQKGISSMLSSNIIAATLAECNMSNEYWPVIVNLFRNVVRLTLDKNNFTVLPESIQELCSLRFLSLNDCKKLGEIRGIPPNIEEFSAARCTSLTSSSKSMLLDEELHEDGNKVFRLPGSSIPEWFEQRTKQDSVSFWFRNKLPEICVCLVENDSVVDQSKVIICKLIINGTEISSSHLAVKNLFVCTLEDHVSLFGLKRTGIDGHILLFRKEWNHVVCSFPNTHTCIKKIGMHVVKHGSSMQNIRFTNPLAMSSWGHSPLKNLLKANVSNSVAQIGISSTTNTQGPRLDDSLRLDLDYESIDSDSDSKISSCLPSYAATKGESSQAPPSDITSGEELHLRTSCTESPTSDDSFRIQIDSSQDDDAEMEKFYASLVSGTDDPSHSHDHLATTAPNDEAKEALKIVKDFIISNDASVFLDLAHCSIMKISLDYLSNLSANGKLSKEMRAIVLEVLMVFKHCSSRYIEASMKIESTASQLLRADELEADLEDNMKQFKEVVTLEKELLKKLAFLEESKKELLKKINAINANISASQSEQKMARTRKRDIFDAGKTLKTEVYLLREKVSYLQHEQDLAKETQAKVNAEWAELGEKLTKLMQNKVQKEFI